MNYTTYYTDNGCESRLELYNFDYGCANLVTSADISAYSGNAILYRKTTDGCVWTLDYMNFDSLDELAKKYIGDNNWDPNKHGQRTQQSVDVNWDYQENKYLVQLYAFGCGG